METKLIEWLLISEKIVFLIIIEIKTQSQLLAVETFWEMKSLTQSFLDLYFAHFRVVYLYCLKALKNSILVIHVSQAHSWRTLCINMHVIKRCYLFLLEKKKYNTHRQQKHLALWNGVALGNIYSPKYPCT